ncbi:hypothetical protein BDV95DRAFT_61151 [Massariosphaeria phaeospora]|uniref:Uncharacterized protein n=1 Tax=Massariosphaeria phaeospora TaxID=100035 RepID=A0A7C8I480_9PLEO|nr:hypothetical protein BDV95DRAFT_61151 [Massariosphaeria phaeospora]
MPRSFRGPLCRFCSRWCLLQLENMPPLARRASRAHRGQRPHSTLFFGSATIATVVMGPPADSNIPASRSAVGTIIPNGLPVRATSTLDPRSQPSDQTQSKALPGVPSSQSASTMDTGLVSERPAVARSVSAQAAEWCPRCGIAVEEPQHDASHGMYAQILH